MNPTMIDFIHKLKEFSATTNERGQTVLRILAALLGGYGLTYSMLVVLARWLPWPRVDIVFFSALFPGLVWLIALLWAFTAPTAQRAWRDIVGGTVFFGILAAFAAWIR